MGAKKATMFVRCASGGNVGVNLGIVLGLSRGRPNAILGPSWARWNPKDAPRKPKVAPRGPKLRPRWANIGKLKPKEQCSKLSTTHFGSSLQGSHRAGNALMGDVNQHAASVVASLTAFQDKLRSERPDAADSLHGLSLLLQALRHDFNLDLVDVRGRKRCLATEAADLSSKLKRKLRAEEQTSARLEETLAETVGAKVNGRLRRMWILRAGLSNPSIPARVLSDFCKEFIVEEAHHISSDYVGKVRDAMCETIKCFSRSALERMCGELPGPLFVTHVHDEALMRVRSFSAALGKSCCRAWYSKVLEHVVTLHGESSSMEWYCELQALASKDACTIATGILKVVDEILECVARVGRASASACRQRVVHIMTGDAIGTNESAAKRMLFHLRPVAARQGITYLMILLKCSSHQSNLVVMTAVCGGKTNNPSESCPVAGTCVRFFKYLVPSYSEEFGISLLLYLQETVRLVALPDQRLEDIEKTRQLAQLYGDGVLPAELLRLDRPAGGPKAGRRPAGGLRLRLRGGGVPEVKGL